MEEKQSVNQAQSGQSPHTASKGGVWWAIVILLIVAAVVIAGVVPRWKARAALVKETRDVAVPTVSLIHPKLGAPQTEIILPGNVQAFADSPIYARTNGYLVKWYHDIGSRVNKGDLLADIETPEVDQQLMQAKADLVTAQANEHLSEITEARYSELLKTDGVSKQEVDNATGDLAAKKAIVQSSEANVRRLQELKSFQKVYAPFTGVVTQRNVDIGTLINAGNGGTSQQLFYLAQTDPIRVYVNVPESYAPSIHKGLGAFLELAQYPGQRFQGEVVRTAEAIDLATRTLLTEVDVPNKSGLLLPGGYAQVHLEVHVQGDRLQVPVNALLFRSEGLRAVVIDANHRVRLQALSIGRDYGTSLEVLTGLKPEDWIVLNPPDSIENGEEVRVKEVKDPLAATAAPAPTQAPTPTSAPEKPTSSPAEKH